jgi:hypothetical protein
MNLLLVGVGLGLTVLGVSIWRFKLINILSNVNANQVDRSRNDDLARYAGCFIMLIGGVFMLLAYLIERVATERELLVLVLCMVAVILISTIFYLAGLGRYMKK